ncbi:FG-GAP-like repeat-containing protein, partial [Parafilimonas sp.]|uniref:FG-GAP-like repeat-containing protein n=1 Tax=Parafilimonas sp. TaxID=1969739 RepID=UPI0039E3C3E4
MNNSFNIPVSNFQGRILFVIAIAALAYSKAFSQEGNLPPRMLAYQYLQQNQVNEAEFAFIKAIKTSPKEILNYRDLAILYLTKKNYSKAESTAKAGLKIKPDDTEVRSVLAKLYIQKGDRLNAILQLKDIVKRSPRNVFAYYALADLGAYNSAIQENFLLKALSIAPANIVVRLNLAELFIRTNKADSAIYYLQGIKKTAPAFSPAVSSAYSQLMQSLQAGNFSNAKMYAGRFHSLLALTGAYIEASSLLEGPKLPVGYAAFASGQVENKSRNAGRGYLASKGFADATGPLGLEFDNAGQAVIAVTDYTDAGDMYLYASSVAAGRQTCRLLSSKIGSFREIAVPGGMDHTAEDHDAVFMDYDNDGYPDLFIATSKGILLCKNNTDGTFAYEKNNIGISLPLDVQKMLFADFDQDGDLDIYASTAGGGRFFRNNSNGTFTEQANAMGLAASGSTGNMDFSDYDGDGDLDIITAGDTKGPVLFSNSRHSKFQNVTSSARLKNIKFSGKAVAFADYNNDGTPDLFLSGSNGQGFLLKNINGSYFSPDDAASKVFAVALRNIKVYDAAFLDYDNDGYADLLVTGTTGSSSSRAVCLFHNDGKGGFSDASSLLPPTTGQATHIAIADFNADGDDDIFLAGPGGIKLIRNDIGNLNHYMQVQLTGLSYGNNKNNRLGIGAQVELKAGDLYQVKTIKRALTNFGIGVCTSPDAVRIVWPNGTPQYIKDPSASERIIEEQMLKGSCPFLYAWNGERYEFVKDMMWRSALGMPLAINGKDTTYAFCDASKEYLLIPGESLKPRNNQYSIKIT